MAHYFRFLTVVMIMAFCVNSMYCSSSSQTVDRSSQEESEEDVLKLLGITEDEEGSQPGRDERIAQLEAQLRQREAEINELKSELVLKDEQISEMRRGVSPAGSPQMPVPAVSGDFYR